MTNTATLNYLHGEKSRTDDARIRAIAELSPPSHIIREFPITPAVEQLICEVRRSIHRILNGEDRRLLVIIGPCSIHDPAAALEYARQLHTEAARHHKELLVLMRVYFEKPRTTVGWKGLINDPYLDGSFRINDGLRLARRLLLEINALGLPVGCEFLDMITPQYFADLVSWGAIGARTTESQVHRELASGLSCPVGFKNGTDGNVRIAVDAVRTASHPHAFLSVTKGGHSAIVYTDGNEDCHIILRGGSSRTNYDEESISSAAQQLAKDGLPQRVMVDFSHGNSNKDYQRQMEVAQSIAEQLTRGSEPIFGVMVESHLKEGRQDLTLDRPMTYGQSITDACLGWEASVTLLRLLAHAVRQGRGKFLAA